MLWYVHSCILVHLDLSYFRPTFCIAWFSIKIFIVDPTKYYLTRITRKKGDTIIALLWDEELLLFPFFSIGCHCHSLDVRYSFWYLLWEVTEQFDQILKYPKSMADCLTSWLSKFLFLLKKNLNKYTHLDQQ